MAGRATYRKRELPNYAVFDERRYFEIDPDGGSCVFDVKGTPVGIVICEDLWFAEPIADTVKNGAQLVLVPNASPFERGKHAQRDALLAARTANPASASPISTPSADRIRSSSTAPPCSPTATARCTRRARFEDHWLVADYDAASRQFTEVWMDAATKAANRWPGARSCAARATTAQERLRQGLDRTVRRHRFGARAGDRGRRAGRRQRHRRAPAVALHVEPQQRPRRRTGRALGVKIITVRSKRRSGFPRRARACISPVPQRT
jgi:hypothetical protein